MPMRRRKTSTINSGGSYKTPSVLDVGSKVESVPKKEANTNQSAGGGN